MKVSSVLYGPWRDFFNPIPGTDIEWMLSSNDDETLTLTIIAVSYTHLDVYKRQVNDLGTRYRREMSAYKAFHAGMDCPTCHRRVTEETLPEVQTALKERCV